MAASAWFEAHALLLGPAQKLAVFHQPHPCQQKAQFSNIFVVYLHDQTKRRRARVEQITGTLRAAKEKPRRSGVFLLQRLLRGSATTRGRALILATKDDGE